jgi:DNA sulfur modification protein DndE
MKPMQSLNVFIMLLIYLIGEGCLTTVIAQPIPESYTSSLPFQMPAVQVASFPDRAVSIADFGAVADGQTMNTKAFTDAIQSCAKAGGGRVNVPAGIWLTGPIRFESNINLHLETGALILFSRNRDDFPLIPVPAPNSKNYACAYPIYGYNVENVAITGDGIIDGSGEQWRPMKRNKYTDGQWNDKMKSGGVVSPDGQMWWPSAQAMNGEEYLKSLRKEKKSLVKEDFAGAKDFLRPNMVVFHSCKKILLDGPTFRNSPKFCINPVQCEHVVIRNIKIQNDWNAQNGDGLDIGSSHTVLVYKCTVDAGDDAICLKPGIVDKGRNWTTACENIIVADCIVYHGHGGFVIGSETYGGTRNISVRNCLFVGTDVGLRFKSSRSRGGLTENVYIDGIRMKNIAGSAIQFDSYYEDDKPARGEIRTSAPITDRTPLFQKFSIKNIVCNGAAQAISVQGLPEQFIRDIDLTNITISARTGVTCLDAEKLQFTNVKILSEQGPVFEIDNARNIMIDHTAYTPGASLFMKVVGSKSENIQLVNTDTKNAKKDFDLGNEVNPKAVIRKM